MHPGCFPVVLSISVVIVTYDDSEFPSFYVATVPLFCIISDSKSSPVLLVEDHGLLCQMLPKDLV